MSLSQLRLNRIESLTVDSVIIVLIDSLFAHIENHNHEKQLIYLLFIYIFRNVIIIEVFTNASCYNHI